MAIEEMLDYLKTLFSDMKFNDLLVKFCSENSPEVKEGDRLFVDVEKVMRLHEVLGHLPVIIRRDGNVSNSMNLLINEDKMKKAH